MSAADLIQRLREFAKATAETVTAENGEQLTYEDSIIWLAADTLASKDTALAEMRVELERITGQRDNLWMAYLHSKLCFHGAVRSTNPDQRAHNDVERAMAGSGPKHGAALNVAKHLGRIPASLLDEEVGR
ncbi:hypothetical protein [Mesorhizobium sp. M0088]|uniref:hypothetical protein n=1 Tax=Mesorhizobium sp. M0088 TaxID=2956873 RepID=UPI003336EDBB